MQLSINVGSACFVFVMLLTVITELIFMRCNILSRYKQDDGSLDEVCRLHAVELNCV